MVCSCDAQKFLIVPVLDQKQILACGRVSGLETPTNTFVTKKRNFPFLEAAQILVFFHHPNSRSNGCKQSTSYSVFEKALPESGIRDFMISNWHQPSASKGRP